MTARELITELQKYDKYLSDLPVGILIETGGGYVYAVTKVATVGYSSLEEPDTPIGIVIQAKA